MPALTTIDQLKATLPALRNVLVLGGGLGSIVEIIRHKSYTPDITLVEQDNTVLKWAMELTMGDYKGKIVPVCMDARIFMEQNTTSYDLIFIDIFDDLVVPPFVFTREFLTFCKHSLYPNGHVAFNYIPTNERESERVQQVFAAVFPDHWMVKTDRNQVFFGKQG